MDTFVNLAEQGFKAYTSSQGNAHQTGGQQFNSPDNRPPQQYSSEHAPQINDDEVVSHASNNSGQDSGLFSQAMNHIRSNPQQHQEPIDEEQVQRAHQQAYSGGSAGGMNASSMGGAAALQALKQFTGGGGGGGGSQQELISFAMQEASQLFDSSGGASSGNKQDAVNGAAMTVMKLLVQSKMSSMIGGGNSGGLGGMGSMMSLVSRYHTM
ncbi:beta-flanking protein [Coniophora puteana RWD-64-598 SS2]|uniref:Beta-flanking protein n=1 Tax=Coniophora puteana (strain RWD-64-598) TaxID=741705 RepID=A0A5M3N6J1_CONPW|nr:beta-flanking protein [Coniophora puteana RWD-64-598 SS2]EIW87043.1 beta-flanking protein [Coniophora puteana RWD-64-598 SS2]